jgi:hypothetical protein
MPDIGVRALRADRPGVHYNNIASVVQGLFYAELGYAES